PLGLVGGIPLPVDLELSDDCLLDIHLKIVRQQAEQDSDICDLLFNLLLALANYPGKLLILSPLRELREFCRLQDDRSGECPQVVELLPVALATELKKLLEQFLADHVLLHEPVLVVPPKEGGVRHVDGILWQRGQGLAMQAVIRLAIEVSVTDPSAHPHLEVRLNGHQASVEEFMEI